jgi:hypothetical protein
MVLFLAPNSYISAHATLTISFFGYVSEDRFNRGQVKFEVD